MLTASQVYTYTRRILDAYTVVMQPLSAELDMAPNAVDILLFLANNPGLDTARDICTYRRLKPGIVSFHVDKLVREGYLLRARDPGDRRRCRLVCTDKAAPIIARGQARQEQFSAADVRGRRADALETFQLLPDGVRCKIWTTSHRGRHSECSRTKHFSARSRSDSFCAGSRSRR